MSTMNRIVTKNGRFWVEGFGWSTTDANKATRFSWKNAYKIALPLHAEVIVI